jgi:hypothetical protein
LHTRSKQYKFDIFNFLMLSMLLHCLALAAHPPARPPNTRQHQARFFIGIGLYIAALIGIAVYSRFKTRETAVQEGSRLREHFMASGSFGTVVMVLSIFSTAFSGYTVVGVPEEASRMG